MTLFDLSPSPLTVGLFTIGWLCGWAMLCRPRRLQAGASGIRQPVAVVMPARDEESAIEDTVARVVAQRRAGDEVVVVDDGSTDATAEVAVAAGAVVVQAPPPPTGWAGKPHACAIGAARTTAELVVFVDADTSLQPDGLDALAAEIARHPGDLVSVQPWHVPRGWQEQLSMFFNITALMGCAAFTLAGDRVPTRVAFGPVIALRRSTYETAGGHAAPGVRGAVLEDIALARAVGRSRLFVGRRAGTTFRMYRGGLPSVVGGWTKSIGIGVSATPWWALAATSAWVASVAGGWLASPWLALASLVQVAILARVAGRFAAGAVVLYPLALAFFVAVVVRSAAVRVTGRTVSWKGRALRPDQRTR